MLEKSRPPGGNKESSREDAGDAGRGSRDEGCSAPWVPGGGPATGRGSGQRGVSGTGTAAAGSPPNRCCSGPVAIAMLMSQRRQEALQRWNRRLASRRVEAILDFSCVKSQGAARAAQFPTAGGPASPLPAPARLAPTVVASPSPAPGEGSQQQAGRGKHCLGPSSGPVPTADAMDERSCRLRLPPLPSAKGPPRPFAPRKQRAASTRRSRRHRATGERHRGRNLCSKPLGRAEFKAPSTPSSPVKPGVPAPRGDERELPKEA